MRRSSRFVAPGLLAMAGGAVWACGATDIPVLLVVQGMDAGVEARVEAGVGAGVEAQAPAQDARSQEAGQSYCQGSGPPVLVVTAADGGSTEKCPDELAQQAFRYALCACIKYVSDHALVTDAFDGTMGAYEAATATVGGSVGVNGDLHPTGPMTIGGSLWASSTMDITTAAVDVLGELHAQGELHPAPSLVVGADAWMASGIQTSGDVTVKGTLHVPSNEPIQVTGMQNFGTPDSMYFQVLPPCDCLSSDLVDIAGVVRTYETQNDDKAQKIDPTMLENVQSDLVLPLSCGRIFFTSIGGAASISLSVQGRVAIFVEGDLSTSDFKIDVPTGSELDLFVGGSVNVGGAFLVGDTSNPANARTYVGGSTVNLQSAATLAGNLYAPKATITLGGTAPTTLFGSMFAQSVSSGSDLTIHYDEAILAPSSACTTPTTCSSCNDCNGQACNGGTCSQCTQSSDCCAPLVCNPQGTCVADIIPR
jgi:hypothetical protein